MRKLLLSIFLLLFISYSFAQKPDGFHAGLFGGLVASQVDGDNYAGYNRLGLQFGGFSNFKFDNVWGAQFEIKYIQKGSKFQSQKTGTFFEVKLDYVEVPILFNYQFDEKMYFEAGLGVAYLIKSAEDRDGSGFTEYDPPFETYEINSIIGFNYILSSRIIGNVKYSYSILPIRPNPGNQVYWGERGSYNNLVSAALYFKF